MLATVFALPLKTEQNELVNAWMSKEMISCICYTDTILTHAMNVYIYM